MVEISNPDRFPTGQGGIAEAEWHARQRAAFLWAPCLPVRHDRREWTTEEQQAYRREYDRAYKVALERFRKSGVR